MNKIIAFAIISAAAAVLCAYAALTARSVYAADSLASRGSYLVHNVGVCTDCHGKDLKGGQLPYKPAFKMPWMPVAPNIRGAGLHHYTEAQLAKIMMVGKRPGNVALMPPMPAYRMNKADATAVARYLKSLK